MPCSYAFFLYAHEKKKRKKKKAFPQRKKTGSEQASKDKTKEPAHLNSKRGNVRFLTRAFLYFALEIHGHLGRTGIKDDTRAITWPRRSPVGRERLGSLPRTDPRDERNGKKRKGDRDEETKNRADCGGNGMEEEGRTNTSR